MDQQEGLGTSIPPLFTRENYAYWSVRMKCHLVSLGWKVQETSENEYKIEYQAPAYSVELSQYEGNAKALNEILSGLTNSIFTKIMQCKTVKKAWDKL